jgi:cyclic pyranopterin phosphate synthase
MVDVGEKTKTARAARARATLRMKPETRRVLLAGEVPKGDALATARIAGIQAAKRTSELIPLCHPLAITGCEVTFESSGDDGRLVVEASVRCADRTGVEMEALTAVTVAALTLYDMLKAIDKGMTIEEVVLLEKQGGRSGHYRREG